jgi:hypothetical protein
LDPFFNWLEEKSLDLGTKLGVLHVPPFHEATMRLLAPYLMLAEEEGGEVEEEGKVVAKGRGRGGRGTKKVAEEEEEDEVYADDVEGYFF